jgi:hypothetical protein
MSVDDTFCVDIFWGLLERGTFSMRRTRRAIAILIQPQRHSVAAFVATFACATLGVATASAQTSGTWSGTTSNAWATTTNWNGGVVPGATSGTTSLDIALFNTNPTNKAPTWSTYLNLAGFTFDVHEIPGHSSGHVVFVLGGSVPPIVFAGDVLFHESIGRTDFPDGDFATLAHGIRDRLYTLPDDTVVFPGHGSPTTVGHEKRHNPFVPAADPRRAH